LGRNRHTEPVRGLRALAALVILTAAACSSPQSTSPGPVSHNLSSPPPLLTTAIAQAAHLGRAGTGTQVDLTLGLKARSPDQLAKLIASGQTITPEQYAAEFGPDPVTVQAALGALTSGGLHAEWRSGSGLIAAGGPAPAVAALFGVDIEDYRLGNGTTFYASLDTPTIPPAIATIFSLPLYGPLLTLKRDPSWGTPMKPQGETVLDLEIIHQVAPAAKMVVYFSAHDFG